MRLYKLLGLAILMVAPTLGAQSRKDIEARAANALKKSADSVRRANAVKVPASGVVVNTQPSKDPLEAGMTDAEIVAASKQPPDSVRQRVYSTTPLPTGNIFNDVSITAGGSAPAAKPPKVEPPKSSPPSYASAGATAPADSPKPKPVVKKRIHTGVAIVKNIGRDFSPTEFADACEKNDMRIMNVPCDLYAEYLRQTDSVVFGEVEDRHDLAAFIRQNVTIVDCIKGGAASKEPISTARGLRRPKGNVVMDRSHAWARYLPKGAKCGYSNNDGKLLFIASCWNLIEENLSVAHLTAPPAPPAAAPPPPAAAPTPPAPAPVWNPPAPTAPTPDLDLPVIREKRGMSGLTKLAIGVGTAVVGGLVYCGPIRESPCSDIFKEPTRKITNTNTTIIHTFNLPNLKF